MHAGLGLAGHPRVRHERPVPDHRDVGCQRPAVRWAHLRRRRNELFRQLSRAPRPRASTAPTFSATASCGWSAATRRQRQRPGLRLPGDDRRPLEQQRLPDDRLSQRDSTPTSTARWATSRSATPTAEGTARSARTTRSSTTSRRTQILTDIVYPGSTTTTAYGIWYNGGTSYTICGGYTSAPQRRQDGRRRLSGRLRLGDRAIHQLDVVRRSERTGRPGLRHPFPGHQQHRAGRLHARRRLDRSRLEHGPRRPRW